MRQVPGWHFFNDHVEVCDVVRPGGIQGLNTDDRAVAEWFITVLGGCQHVLDVGCGSGFPSIYIANHVGMIDAVDAAPNAIVRAQEHATSLGVENIIFTAGGDNGLLFADASFDGVMLCGVLESMAWDCVHQTLSEIRRVLTPGGRIAILEQDWADVLQKRPATTTKLRFHDNHPLLQCIERIIVLPLERTHYYLLDNNTSFTKSLLTQHNAKQPLIIMEEEIDQQSVLDAWYDEWAQFDLASLKDLVIAHGFDIVQSSAQPIWNRQVLLLSAIKSR